MKKKAAWYPRKPTKEVIAKRKAWITTNPEKAELARKRRVMNYFKKRKAEKLKTLHKPTGVSGSIPKV